MLVPLAERCGHTQGIDLSDAMLAICQDKLRRAKMPVTKAWVAIGDICNFNLSRTFDLIIAPYRVLQNLETDSQIQGLFRCLRLHLSSRGTCVLNVFRPHAEPGGIAPELGQQQGDVSLAGRGRGRPSDVSREVRSHRLRPADFYPELIWRRYEHEAMVDEAV